MTSVGDALRFVTSTVDATVVNPITTRLSNSVANPMVLSYVVWEYLKHLTPQRARDLTRMLSTAITSGLGILKGEQGRQLTQTAKRLQNDMLQAIVTPEGTSVVLNAVATASKIAQALNTPETKVAIGQVVETTQSIIDFLASERGRKVVSTVGDCLTQVCAVAAAPETSVFLAQVATNMLHALEAEAARREEEAESKGREKEKEMQKAEAEADATNDARAEASVEEEKEEEIEVDVKMERRRKDTEDDVKEIEGVELLPIGESSCSISETDSTLSSETPSSLTVETSALKPRDANKSRLRQEQKKDRPVEQPRRKETSASRSARIERDVLLKMGVDPELVVGFQRVIDKIRAEEEEKEQENAQRRWENERAALVKSDSEDDDDTFGFAFGEHTAAPPSENVKPEDEKGSDDVLIPEWHDDLVRDAMRRRHATSERTMNERHPFEDQAREMAEVLSRKRFEDQAREMTAVLRRQHIPYGDLTPSDVAACRAISKMITICVLFVGVMVMISITRRVFGF